MSETSSGSADALLKTPLHALHVGSGARMSPFAGYQMPVFYSSIYEEAAAVRGSCGVFDVSHMARFIFPAEATPALQRLLTCDVGRIRAGAGSYALVLSEEGGILDDVILYRKPDGQFLLVVNASNHEKILNWIHSKIGRTGAPQDITADTAMLAVQGPQAQEILQEALTPGVGGRTAAELGYFGISNMRWTIFDQMESLVARTGYTGEDGFEIIAPAGIAEKIWKWLTETGTVAACGLGARDVLRVEAGYSLYGSDMDETTSPYECGLGFAVAKDAPYIGAEALKARPIRRRLIGLDAGSQPSAVLRHGYPILSDGRPAGQVTSGVFSRTLGRSIGFGSVDAGLSETAPLSVDIRGRMVPVKRGSRRFVRDRVKAHSQGGT
ncbi:glycine cleavage system aminomethyltransferase GcvT [bacterium]|nr:glycine cleavage system aminomethyltransferase GcvT [bacterium]